MAKKIAVLDLLPSLRAERFLAESDLSRQKPADVRKLAELAYGDSDLAARFAKEIYRQQLEQAAEDGEQ